MSVPALPMRCLLELASCPPLAVSKLSFFLLIFHLLLFLF